MCAYTYISSYTHTHVCVSVCIHINTRAHTHNTHTNTHTHTLQLLKLGRGLDILLEKGILTELLVVAANLVQRKVAVVAHFLEHLRGLGFRV